ncbi:MAG: hypothetical protein INF48_04550 [Rhodobacter sp.]|nr:hypothetical protein [Rhodobacter sp.]
MRSINDKGLGLRLRLPFRIGGPGPLVRAKPARRVQRGTQSLTLKVTRGAGAVPLQPLQVDRAVLALGLSGLAGGTAGPDLPAPPIAAARALLAEPGPAGDVISWRRKSAARPMP